MRPLLLILLLALTSVSAATEKRAGVHPLAAARRELLQGNLDAALAVVEETEKRDGASALTHHLRGIVLMEQGKLDEAVASLKAAHEAEPGFFSARALGDALLRAKKWEEARAVYLAAIKATNILMLSERLRFALLMTHLGAQDTVGAKEAFERVTFPTETAAYYYSQAAWAFANGDTREGKKWLRTADEIFDERRTDWFARPLYDFGWIKRKPNPVLE
ncbi:hypothetical protein BH20VER1_BH20VER1_28820 [soil metagenome]